MKKLLLVIATCYVVTNSTAQTNPVFGTYTIDVDSLFLHMDKSGITTGILYDRVFPFANLPFFNVNTNQPDTIDFSFFIQGSSELRRAAYTFNNNLPPAADYFYEVKKQATFNNTVNISVVSYNYNYIDTSAIDNGLLYIGSTDSLFYDVPGRPNSPFLLKQTTFVSPVDSALDYSTGQFSFKFNDSNYYRNHSKVINRVLINFNNGGGDIVFNSGTSYSPVYASSGEKICRATVEFTDGTSSTNYFTIQVKNIGAGFRIGNPVPDDTKSFLATRGFIGYDESITRYAQANIGIYYADQTIGTTKRIKKPIIITDGIDFTQSTKFKDLYEKYLIYYDPNNFKKSLIDELNLKGYDVILLDYDDVTDRSVLLPNKQIFKQPGADYVERNAMVVVDVIEWANSELTSQGLTDKLIVIGPSMGGLITRYALRWMETNNLNHNCRLWVSFDAPHRGANIPIGSQYTLEFFAVYGENEDAKKSIETRLDAPAAKEFIIHHYSANSVAQAGAPGFRNRFNTDIENLGWPQATGLRRVSLVNGNISGILTNTPEDKSLEVEGKPARFGGQLLVFLFHLGRLRVIGTESYFTTNNYSTSRVFYGYRFKPFGASIYYTKVAATQSGSCSIDNSPGGIYDTQQQIADQIPPVTQPPGIRIRLKVLALVPTHSFIPTKSALGSYNFTNWCENLYNRNLVCSNEIPFDNYYAPVSNSEPHVFLSSQNVQWMFNELDGTPQPAPGANPYTIQLQSGNEPVCNTATYKICPIPTGTITWTSSNLGIGSIPSPSNGNTVVVTRAGDGNITLTATVGSYAATRQITVGAPYIAATVEGANPASPNGGYYYWLQLPPYTPPISNIFWRVPNGWTLFSGQGTMQVTVYTGTTGGDVEVSFDDACGVNRAFFKNVTIGGGGPDPLRPSGEGITVYPNPASEIITVSLNGSSPKTTTTFIREIRITNKMGLMVQDFVYKDQQQSKQLNIALLKPDVYTIQVYDNKIWQSVKLSKQ